MAEGFIDLMRETKLPLEEVDYIRNNPEGLTKEGIDYSVKLWKSSNNRYVLAKYNKMITECKNISTSGKTVDGRVVLARLDGKITWAEKPEIIES